MPFRAAHKNVKILLIGSEGSMGKRYQAILKYLNYIFDCVDINISPKCAMDDYTHFIIASPTEAHYNYLINLLPLSNKFILCEKPITKNIIELRLLADLLEASSSRLNMVLQYGELLKFKTNNMSYYDYFKTGNDGLFWDCLQIIHFSEAIPSLNNNSPIWKCKINGQILNIQDMDLAYVSFIQKWLNAQLDQDIDSIIKTHIKIKELQDDFDSKS